MLLRDPGIAVKIINRKNAAHDHKKADKQDFPGAEIKACNKAGHFRRSGSDGYTESESGKQLTAPFLLQGFR